MVKYLLIFLLVIFTTPCQAKIGINRGYSIITIQEYYELLQKGKVTPLKRYIIVPEFDKNYKNILNEHDERKLLSMFSYMLKKNSENYIREYIMNYDSAIGINNLIASLYYFSRNDYAQARSYLEKFEDPDLNFLRLLLIADCTYELLINKKDFTEALNKYQVAFDSTEDELLKSIVNNRIKFIKYQ